MPVSKSRDRFNKKAKQMSKPRRPLTSYNLFYKHQRALIKNNKLPCAPKRGGAQGSFIGSLWRNLDQVTRCQYEIQATEEFKQYEAKYAEWKFNSSSTVQKSQDEDDLTTMTCQNSVGSTEHCTSNPEASNTTSSVHMQRPQKGISFSDVSSFCAHTKIGVSFSEEMVLPYTPCTAETCAQLQRIFLSIQTTRSYMDDEFVNFLSTLPFEAEK